MGQPFASAESSLFYDLPAAHYTGDKATNLARRYSGASQLVRFAVTSAFGWRPEMRVQAEGWARRGSLDIAFRRYHDQLMSGVTSGEVQLQSVRFKPPDALDPAELLA